MQRFIGRVVATTLPKTCTVLVETQHAAPKNPAKVVYKHKRYLVHDEKNLTVTGDIVAIEYYKKLSSKKAFIVTEILKGARTWIDPNTGQVYTHN
jgi:small subunit ribosomal protein S17